MDEVRPQLRGQGLQVRVGDIRVSRVCIEHITRTRDGVSQGELCSAFVKLVYSKLCQSPRTEGSPQIA